MKVSLDLGSGPAPKNPFSAEKVVGADLVSFGSGVLVCNLGFEPLPFEDSSVDYCTAFDLLEHIPRVGGVAPNRNPFIFLMNEVWRVLRADGLFFSQTPAFPSANAFSDPTHVNYITADTIRYFASELTGDGKIIVDDRLDLGRRYGFNGNFVALRNYGTARYGHQIWLLRAKK